ncbi:TPA: hypothetical protein I7256_22705 [Vibrio vulnificus]|nr:hypothetical protein [Marinomonas sp. CT5]QUX97742.1 hypothetical protein C0J08_21040 [Marinomonas sp. CT5]HAS6415323.1 hypothetical protein [Vibrio vulnificus]
MKKILLGSALSVGCLNFVHAHAVGHVIDGTAEGGRPSATLVNRAAGTAYLHFLAFLWFVLSFSLVTGQQVGLCFQSVQLGTGAVHLAGKLGGLVLVALLFGLGFLAVQFGQLLAFFVRL